MIKRNKPEEQLIPADLDAIAKNAMYWQVASQHAEEIYKEVKADFFERVEKHPQIEMVVGKSLKVSTGKVRWQSRENFDVLQDEIEKALESGRITVPVLLGMVKSYDTDAVRQFVPAAVVPNAEKPVTEYGVMVASADYKAEVHAKVDELLNQSPAPAVLPPNVAVMKPAASVPLTEQLEASLADAKKKRSRKPATA